VYLQRLRTSLATEVKYDESLRQEPKDGSQSEDSPPDLPDE
jgi:hypothetical protein